MRILVIDDHALFREALRYLLRDLDPSAVVIEASSSEEALDAVADYPDLSLILLDLHLPGANGLSVLPILRQRAPAVPVVVLSAEQDPTAIREAITAGAQGFIPKTAGSQEISRALQLVREGKTYTPPARRHC